MFRIGLIYKLQPNSVFHIPQYACYSCVCTQWCIAKNEGGYTQRGVAKGLKVPCLFIITEASIRCQKNRRLVYRVYLRRPIPPPPQYITVCTVVVVWSYEPKSYGLVRLHRNTFLRIYYLLHLGLL